MSEEADLQRAIAAFFKARGALVFRLQAGHRLQNLQLCPNGTPDLLVVEKGRRVWIEVKGPKGKFNADQVAMHERLRALGEEVVVARKIEDVT